MEVQNTTLLPGQRKVTQEEFEKFAFAQITELWTQFGSLSEIWMDGGYQQNLKKEITELLAKHQSDAAVWNGYGVSPSPIRWDRTESGLPSSPQWSTGYIDGPGDPDSDVWCPVGCDTTLQLDDSWFFTPGLGIRTLDDLINVYHQTVGNNGVLEIDFAIDRTGRVHPQHAARYKLFGDWIRSCYGFPLSSTSGGGSEWEIELNGDTIDRVVIQEDQRKGQRIRAYSIEALIITGDGKGSWVPFSKGTSVGNKRIDVIPKPLTSVRRLRLTADEYIQTPQLLNFAVFSPC
eukprot:TRINITY_DN12731_c0_g1_i2.p1 TRINITY_DN12731_c0_g1~~TRINITY_DN12731_c0_g1_i2.p1  ORF type:complete len:290 (-),score=66.72 TRINITY_DN12731_c0_g1_i2:28-897(-)